MKPLMIYFLVNFFFSVPISDTCRLSNKRFRFFVDVTSWFCWIKMVPVIPRRNKWLIDKSSPFPITKSVWNMKSSKRKKNINKYHFSPITKLAGTKKFFETKLTKLIRIFFYWGMWQPPAINHEHLLPYICTDL